MDRCGSANARPSKQESVAVGSSTSNEDNIVLCPRSIYVYIHLYTVIACTHKACRHIYACIFFFS